MGRLLVVVAVVVRVVVVISSPIGPTRIWASHGRVGSIQSLGVTWTFRAYSKFGCHIDVWGSSTDLPHRTTDPLYI